jgi:hypothetical protein
MTPVQTPSTVSLARLDDNSDDGGLEETALLHIRVTNASFKAS